MREYKVKNVKKRGLLQTAFKADDLEKILNEEAKEGWIYHNTIVGTTQVLDKDTFMLIFYREK